MPNAQQLVLRETILELVKNSSYRDVNITGEGLQISS